MSSSLRVPTSTNLELSFIMHGSAIRSVRSQFEKEETQKPTVEIYSITQGLLAK